MKKLFLTILILSLFQMSTNQVMAYRVGVDYHATDADINYSPFIRKYHKPGVRDLVKSQLQSMADSGAEVIDTRLWLTDLDPNSFPDVSQRLTFPFAEQDLKNIRQYVQDVAAIKTPGGKPLDLYLTLLWQGVADYQTGYSQWGNLSWDQYVYYAKYSIDQFFTTIGDLTRSDGKKAVTLAYFDGEVTTVKANTTKWLTQVYPYFVETANKTGIAPTLYFLADFNGDLNVYFTPTINFMKQNNLYLPPRIDISYYAYNIDNASLNNFFNNLTAICPGHTFGIAETYYYQNPTLRKSYGQAFANYAATHPTLEELLFWTTPDSGGTGINASFPFDIASYLPIPPTGTIMASPNPCVVSASGTCTSTISWTSTDASQPVVYVGGSLFAQGSAGSQNTWGIPAETNYTFTLYDKPGGVALSSIVVGANSSTQKPGDFNNDGNVDDGDFTLLKSNFGSPYTIFDYNLLVGNWGK